MLSKKKKELAGIVTKKNGYKIEAKYSEKAIEDKLIRFTKGKETIEISAAELIEVLATQVNSETLAPTFVDSTRVNVVKVLRAIQVQLNRDYKAGEQVQFQYEHAYPLEFALIEESWKIALINKEAGVTELTKELIDKCKAKIEPRMKEFVKKAYSSISSLDLEGKK